MRNALRTILIAALTATGAWAQHQIATVTSKALFTLRGAQVSVGQGVPDWPVLADDTIVAGTKPTTVVLPDQSALTLTPSSTAHVTLAGDKVVFQIVQGTVRYKLKSPGAAVLVANGQTVVPGALAGVVSSGGSSVAAGAATAGWWTAGHTVAVVAVGAGTAGAVVGVRAAVDNGPAVSQSK